MPRVRAVADYHRNVEALQAMPTFTRAPGGSLAAPYLRWHPPLPGMYDDSSQPEYDVDEADEAWLDKANAAAAANVEAGTKQGERGGAGATGAKGKGGIIAAARGLYATVASRFRSSNGGCEAQTPRASDAGNGGSGGGGSGGLRVVDFERAIDKLELLHFAAVGMWWSDLNDGEHTVLGVWGAWQCAGTRARGHLCVC